VSTQCELIQT